MEHSSFSLETMSQICIASLEVGHHAVRARASGLADVQRILDGGALGIFAPHVQSAAEARDYVRCAKYPPLGERSNAGNLPHLQYRSFPAAEAYAAIDAATDGDRRVQFRRAQPRSTTPTPSWRSAKASIWC